MGKPIENKTRTMTIYMHECAFFYLIKLYYRIPFYDNLI